MIYSGQQIQIHRFTVNPFQENTYLVVKGENAVLVDPGFFNATEWDACGKLLATGNLHLASIVLTHAHIDHVLGISPVLSRFPSLNVYMHPQEKANWDRAVTAAAMFGIPYTHPTVQPLMLPESGTYTTGGISFDIRFVPGHSPGHVSLQPDSEPVVLCGDVIFYRSIGRTDLPGGSLQQLTHSIQTQVYTLAPETMLLPGHGPDTTAGDEKVNNPFVRG